MLISQLLSTSMITNLKKKEKLSEHVQNCIKQTFTFVGLAFYELNYKLKHT